MRRSCIAAVAHNTVGLGYELKVARATRTRSTATRPRYAREARAALGASRSATDAQAPLVHQAADDRLLGQVRGRQRLPGGRPQPAHRQDLRPVPRPRQAHPPPRRTGRAGSCSTARERVIPGGASGSTTSAQKVNYDDDGSADRPSQGTGLRWETNEMIPFQLYTSESRDYGLPPDAQLAGDYLGDKLAGDTNVSFFGSSGVPPTVIFVQGEETDEGPGHVRSRSTRGSSPRSPTPCAAGRTPAGASRSSACPPASRPRSRTSP
jgi:hypothetical protein